MEIERLVVPPHLLVHVSEPVIAARGLWLELDGVVQVHDGFVEAAGAVENPSEARLHGRRQRIQPLRAFHVGDGFVEAAQGHGQHAVEEMRVTIVRIDVEGAAEVIPGGRPVPVVAERDPSHRHMRLGQLVIQLQRRASRRS